MLICIVAHRRLPKSFATMISNFHICMILITHTMYEITNFDEFSTDADQYRNESNEENRFYF